VRLRDEGALGHDNASGSIRFTSNSGACLACRTATLQSPNELSVPKDVIEDLGWRIFEFCTSKSKITADVDGY
jgi:hypothetical protein